MRPLALRTGSPVLADYDALLGISERPRGQLVGPSFNSDSSDTVQSGPGVTLREVTLSGRPETGGYAILPGLGYCQRLVAYFEFGGYWNLEVTGRRVAPDGISYC